MVLLGVVVVVAFVVAPLQAVGMATLRGDERGSDESTLTGGFPPTEDPGDLSFPALARSLSELFESPPRLPKADLRKKRFAALWPDGLIVFRCVVCCYPMFVQWIDTMYLFTTTVYGEMTTVRSQPMQVGCTITSTYCLMGFIHSITFIIIIFKWVLSQ